MKLKEKFQRFWTLSKSREGFTLVELIVVIAILAILAGVAIPVYNGYIKKANTAADQQLLDTVNTSFVAALAENGYSHLDVTRAKITIEADGTIGVASDEGISYVQSAVVDGVNATNDINTAFAFYYGENEDATFNTFKALRFDPAQGMFVEGVAIALSYGGGTIYFNDSDIADLNNSTFATLGTDALLDKVADVSSFAALAGNATLESIFTSEDFKKSAAEALGIDTTAADWQTTYGAEAEKLIQQVAADKGVDADQAMAMVNANAAVLYAAKNASNMNVSDVTNLLKNEGAKDVIGGNLSTDTGKALSQAALAYGMYTAYTYSRTDLTDEQKAEATSSPTTVLGQLDDEAFRSYIETEQGQADIQGYLSAMGMINSSSEDKDAVSSVVANGFSDPALKELFAGLIG